MSSQFPSNIFTKLQKDILVTKKYNLMPYVSEKCFFSKSIDERVKSWLTLIPIQLQKQPTNLNGAFSKVFIAVTVYSSNVFTVYVKQAKTPKYCKLLKRYSYMSLQMYFTPSFCKIPHTKGFFSKDDLFFYTNWLIGTLRQEFCQ